MLFAFDYRSDADLAPITTATLQQYRQDLALLQEQHLRNNHFPKNPVTALEPHFAGSFFDQAVNKRLRFITDF